MFCLSFTLPKCCGWNCGFCEPVTSNVSLTHVLSARKVQVQSVLCAWKRNGFGRKERWDLDRRLTLGAGIKHQVKESVVVCGDKIRRDKGSGAIQCCWVDFCSVHISQLATQAQVNETPSTQKDVGCWSRILARGSRLFFLKHVKVIFSQCLRANKSQQRMFIRLTNLLLTLWGFLQMNQNGFSCTKSSWSWKEIACLWTFSFPKRKLLQICLPGI